MSTLDPNNGMMTPSASREPSPNPENDAAKAAQKPPTFAVQVTPDDSPEPDEDSSELRGQKRKDPHPEVGDNRRGRWAEVTDEELKYILEKLDLPADGKKEDKVNRLEGQKWTQADVVEWKSTGGKSGKTLKIGKLHEISQKILARTNSESTSGAANQSQQDAGPALATNSETESGSEKQNQQDGGPTVAANSESDSGSANQSQQDAGGPTLATNSETDSSSANNENQQDKSQHTNTKTNTLLPATYYELLRRTDVEFALPRLAGLEAMKPEVLLRCFAEFRADAPEFCLLSWAWLEFSLEGVKEIKDGENLLTVICRPAKQLVEELTAWDWGTEKDGPKKAYDRQREMENMSDLWSLAHPGVPQDLGPNMALQMGLPLIKRLAGKQQYTPLLLEDPDFRGVQVEGQIIGRSVRKSSWLAIILPSRNESGFLRGHWVDGNKHSEVFKRYAKSTNHTLSVASGQDLLEDCEAKDFLTIAVFQMKWGKTYHTHALGIPFYDPSRPPALFSKSMMASKWGKKTAEKLCYNHMHSAGQKNLLGKTNHDLDAISARGWQN